LFLALLASLLSGCLEITDLIKMDQAAANLNQHIQTTSSPITPPPATTPPTIIEILDKNTENMLAAEAVLALSLCLVVMRRKRKETIKTIELGPADKAQLQFLAGSLNGFVKKLEVTDTGRH